MDQAILAQLDKEVLNHAVALSNLEAEKEKIKILEIDLQNALANLELERKKNAVLEEEKTAIYQDLMDSLIYYLEDEMRMKVNVEEKIEIRIEEERVTIYQDLIDSLTSYLESEMRIKNK